MRRNLHPRPIPSLRSTNSFHENSKQGQDPFAMSPKLLHFLPMEDIWASRTWLRLHRFSSKVRDLIWPAFFNPNELAKPYERGSLVISRLCPVDYHRFHFPVQGHVSQPKLINGFLYSVNPLALRKKFQSFGRTNAFLAL